jgi:ligand-binding sensor domain-containing protein/DNA-binding CsgD family transcriptional regulator
MILHLLEDRKGRLWIGTDGGGLNVLSTNSLKWTRYQNDPRDPKSLSHTRVKALYQDKKGNIWIGTFGGGLNRFDDKTGTFTRYIGRRSNPNGLMNNYIFSILEDRDNRFWVGTSNGVHEFIRDRNEFVHHGHIPGDPGSFSLYSAEFIFEDRSGLLWMGSSNGINLLDKRRKKFHHIYDKHSVLDGNIPDSLSHNHVDAIYESQDGLLWFGTWGGGLNAYDPESGSFTFFKNRPDDPGAISCNTVSCIYEEDSGNLWIGTKKGLNYFNRRKRTFTRFYHNPENSNSLADDFISSIEEGYEGMIWIGTINGLDRFNPRTHSFHHFKHDPRNPNSLNSNSINCLLLDQQQNLWVGTSESGLNRYDENDDTFYQYMTEPANPASLSCNQINTIFETRAGTIWVGTADGLNRFIPEQDSFQSFTHKEGLPHHYISSILEDENRYLWISTIKGISKFNPAKNSFRNYGSRDGLVNGNFTACSHKTRSGEMFFGSTHGINSFVPEKVKDNPYIPPIVFTSVTIHTQGKELRARESPTDKIRLSYRDTVSIHFAALSYTRPSRNRYAYKINTLHDSWIHLGNQHEIILAGMEPGEYILHVKGSNHDGVWNHEGASIGLIISPPFWKTWWFRILAVIFIILLILIWHRTRMKNMAHRLKTEAAVSQFLAIHDISRREREILKLMLQGKSNKEIEDLLFISLHTVKNHVYHIFQKLKINSRGQLINLFREYLLSQEEE